MSRHYGLHAVAVAALITSISPLAQQGKPDVTAPATFAGTYSPDCSSAAAPRVRVSAEALAVEDGSRRMQGAAPRSAPTYFAAVPPPGFQTALISNVSQGEQIVFVVSRTASGYAIKLNGSANVQETLGKILLAQTFQQCSTPPRGGVITTIAGGGGSCNATLDGSPAATASFCFPNGVAVDKAGTVYIASTNGDRIFRVDPAGAIYAFAGSGHNSTFSGDGGPANRAELSHPFDVITDRAGNLYVSDSSNQRIRKITPAGVITTVAGSDNPGGQTGDGGPATRAKLDQPRGMAVDSAGNLYIATNNSHRIRKVTPAGIISTIAGSGPLAGGDGGDGGPATGARLFGPSGLAVDAADNLYIADQGNNRIRKVTPDGTITTVAGNGQGGFSGDGGPALQARLNNPYAVAFDSAGNLYIADFVNGRIRKVTPAGIISTVAGNGLRGSNGDGGPPLAAQIGNPSGVAVDAADNLYFVDNANGRVRKVTFASSTRPETTTSTAKPATTSSTTRPEMELVTLLAHVLAKDFVLDWQTIATLQGFKWAPLPLAAMPQCLADGSCSSRAGIATIAGRSFSVFAVGTPTVVSQLLFRNATAPLGSAVMVSALKDAGLTPELARCPVAGATTTANWYRLRSPATKPAYLSIQTQCSGKPCETFVLTPGETLPALVPAQAPLYTERCAGR